MTPRAIKKAIAEAKRFLEVAKSVPLNDRDFDSYFLPSKETAAAKRASMDLTRALADMRRFM